MNKNEFKLEKINEAELDIKVNARWDGFPYSYSEDKIRVYTIKIVHKATGLTASADSNTTIDMGYKYALNELEEKYNKLVSKKMSSKKHISKQPVDAELIRKEWLEYRR